MCLYSLLSASSLRSLRPRSSLQKSSDLAAPSRAQPHAIKSALLLDDDKQTMHKCFWPGVLFAPG